MRRFVTGRSLRAAAAAGEQKQCIVEKFRQARWLRNFSSVLVLAVLLATGCGDGGVDYDDTDGDNPELPTYDLVVGVTSTHLLGALQIKITHLGNSGGFVGRNDQVDCDPLVDAMMAQNWPSERTAQVGLINIQGFRTPAAVVRCGFRTREALSPNSFLVEAVDASDAGNDPSPMDPGPTVAVLSVDRR